MGCFFSALTHADRCRHPQISGVILFAVYIIEVALGTLIHLRRPKHGPAHPPRNVIHVLLGLVIFGLSIYEVNYELARGVVHLLTLYPRNRRSTGQTEIQV